MFWEYLTDMSFILIAIIGSIVALLYTFIRRTSKRRAR
ncbi:MULTISPECIES: EYxxD motif small membrane protein [Bacillaceae]